MEIINYLISEDEKVYGKTSRGDIIRFATIEKLAGIMVTKGLITKEEMDELMKMENPEDKDVLDNN